MNTLTFLSFWGLAFQSTLAMASATDFNAKLQNYGISYAVKAAADELELPIESISREAIRVWNHEIGSGKMHVQVALRVNQRLICRTLVLISERNGGLLDVDPLEGRNHCN